jgi:hypothetical protein
MSASVVTKEHIAALVNAADRHAAAYHGQFEWYVDTEDGRTHYTLSRTGEDRVEDGYTVDLGDGIDYTYPEHITVSAETLGAMLLFENVRSVSYRYREADPNNLPGSIAQDNTLYRHDYNVHVSPLAVLKAIACYTYQACEHPGWQSSPAKAFCEVLTEAMIMDLPGYDDIPWGLDADNIREVAV